MDAPPSLPACHLPCLCSPLPSIQGSCLATLINPFNDAIDAISFFFSQKLLEILPVSVHPQGEALTPRLLCELELAFSMGKDHLVVSVDQGHSQRSTKGHLYRFLDFQNNFLGLQIRQSSVLVTQCSICILEKSRFGIFKFFYGSMGYAVQFLHLIHEPSKISTAFRIKLPGCGLTAPDNS